MGRAIINQKDDLHPVLGADRKPETTERKDWRILYFRNHHIREQHAIQLMRLLLLEPEAEDLQDYAMSIDDNSRHQRINAIKEERSKIDLKTAIGKHDNHSRLRELTAYEYASRYHFLLRFSEDEQDNIKQEDIFGSMMGDLIELLDEEYEKQWRRNPDDYSTAYKNVGYTFRGES